MRRLRKLKIFGLLPAAAWLMSQAIMLSLLAPAMANATPTAYGTTGLPFAASAICGTIGKIGQTPANKGGSAFSGKCPWCQTFGKAPLPPPPSLSAAAPSLPFYFIKHEVGEQRPSGSVRISYIQSRAPPL